MKLSLRTRVRSPPRPQPVKPPLPPLKDEEPPLTINVETSRQPSGRVGEQPPESGVAGLSLRTQAYNQQLLEHLQTLKRIMDLDEQSGYLPRLGHSDCSQLLAKCVFDLKMLQFQCWKVVSSVGERVIPLKVNSAGDGSRGPARVVEVLPDCMLTFSVEVADRKLPLKVFVQYAKKQGIQRKTYRANRSLLRPSTAKVRGPVHDVETYGDLTVYCS